MKKIKWNNIINLVMFIVSGIVSIKCVITFIQSYLSLFGIGQICQLTYLGFVCLIVCPIIMVQSFNEIKDSFMKGE